MFSLTRASLALLPLLAAQSVLADPGFTLSDHPGESLDVLRDGKIIARYMDGHDTSTPARRTDTYKPYLHVFDPAGTAPITKGPGGTFPHHRAIFIGWSKISVDGKKFDRWHMAGGDQVHEKFTAQQAGADRASFTSLVKWTGEKPDQTILEEERTLTFLPGAAPAYSVIDMVSKIHATAGETVLDGDPEHAGLQFRPAEEVDRKQTSYLYPIENALPHKDRDYPWFAETYTLKGQRYTVVYLSHPANPKGGVTSAYRDYGRFGQFWKTTIPAGGSADFRARFLVIAGEMPPVDYIQKAWNDYAGANEPTPKVTAKAAEVDQSANAKTAAAKPAATPDIALLPKPETLAKPQVVAQLADAKPATNTKTDAGMPGPEVAIAAAKSAKRAGGGPEDPVLHFRLPPPPVLTPEEELKTFKLPPGFKIELVASEPLIDSPTALSWDDQGRMYVCEMRDYMHDVDGAGEDQPTGRITRLEDTKGDGVMDKATVFADKLLMPRAVMALGDGALVAEPPNLIWFHDTNGDGVADSQEVMANNFAQRDGQPEHMANSPTWMMDNWIWPTGHSTRYRLQGGKFLAEPTIGSGQWGRTQDDWGRQFTNSNSDLLRADLFPPNYYLRNPHLTDRMGVGYQVMKDQTTWPSVATPGVNRGYIEDTTKPDGTLARGSLRPDGSLQSVTATCGPTIYRGDLFPKEYLGNAFIPEPAGNLVKRLILSEKDGVINAKNAYEGKEFLTSTDERFRPVNAYTGPDGALYIVDMSRGVIQHKGFLTYYLVANIKDRKLEEPYNRGRIFRIMPDGTKPTTVKLPHEADKIAPFLTNGNGWVRDTAQRLLVERGDAAVVPAVQKIAATATMTQARVQALWTLEGLNGLAPGVINTALQDHDEKVRVAGVRLAGADQTADLVKLANDPSGEVRMYLAFVLSGRQGPGVDAALTTILQQATSPLYAEAVVSGLYGHELEFLEALLKQPVQDDEKLSASGILGTLASAVMKERRGPRIAHLLELVAAQPMDSSRQLAILSAMTPKSQKAATKGAPLPNAIKLDAAPAALVTLQADVKSKAAPLVAKIDRQLTWPGKPGAVEVKVVPLTPDQQALFQRGKGIYATLCGACHQPTGAGMPGLAPPLLDSEWALGPADRPIRIVLGGLSGPIEVVGTKWQLEMPALPILSDEDIAGVLTYIRREWDHNQGPVAPSEVSTIRAAIKDRSKPWSAEELQKPFEIKTAKAN